MCLCFIFSWIWSNTTKLFNSQNHLLRVDLRGYNVDHDGVQRNHQVNILVSLLEHVSAAPLSVLSACGTKRGRVQSVARYFVHGCSVFLPRSLGGWGWQLKPRALSPSAALTRGGRITLTVQNILSARALRLLSTSPGYSHQHDSLCLLAYWAERINKDYRVK